jgi:hypothetical protein
MGLLDEDATDDVSSYLGDEPGRFGGGERGPEAITPSGSKRQLGTDPFALGGNGCPHRFDGVCVGWSCISHSGHHESLVDEASNPHFDSQRTRTCRVSLAWASSTTPERAIWADGEDRRAER